MGAVGAAIADGVLTFMWVFCASSLKVLTFVIATAFGVAATQRLTILFITTCLVFTFLFIFGIMGAAMGGATFNPTATAAFHVVDIAGRNSNSLFFGLRFPAQAAGAVGGALAISHFMPFQYKHMLGGPSLKVGLHIGAMAEGFLTFVLTFIVLFVVLRGPNSPILKNWLISLSTVALAVSGSGYTGPSMNPASAFGWAYLSNVHNTWDHFYVYWICPFIGAILAARVFLFVFPPPGEKQKKA
ncbi:OLC1v1016189C1 [Oldenlandia corymbosa var. corymbosa]|uniref:OLC1v1016189C1 n=1 Tax=Oldenlandia corymbosa var. corymbosa TaxID=529605 RepID=A0AAV1E7A4_OLDCO|nr:OLC1v1016189C1 [Oldenlandia corymbosa var. corymbosa]